MSAHSEVMQLLNRMRIAANDPARVQVLTDQMEVLVRAKADPLLPIPDSNLTALEARILGRMMQDVGKCLNKYALFDAVYFDRIGDEPDVKIIDIKICALRKKLRGTGYAIQTFHGRGYGLMVCA